MEDEELQPHLCRCSFLLWHQIKALSSIIVLEWSWGAVWKPALGHLSGCPAQQPARGVLMAFTPREDLQSAVKNAIERNIQCGGAAFKVFVQSGVCTAKCDIVAKVTACLLFWQKQKNTEYRQTVSFCFV